MRRALAIVAVVLGIVAAAFGTCSECRLWAMGWERGHILMLAYTVLTFVLAVFAFWTWWTTRENGRRQTRAYLEINFRWFRPDGEDWKEDLQVSDGRYLTRVFIANYGHSPALNVRFKGACGRHSESPTPEVIDDAVGIVDDTLPADASKPTQCNPAGVGALPLYRDVPGVEATLHPREAKDVYAYGFVGYHDVFGEKHFTRFCARWDQDLKDKTEGGWVPADHYNNAT